MTKNNHQQFIQTIRLYRENIRKFQYCFEHKDFSITEKKLLLAYSHFKKNHLQEVFQDLKQTHFQEPFYEAFRFYVLGLSYNQSGAFNFALENLNNSITILEQHQLTDFLPDVYVLLGLIYANRREFNSVLPILNKLDQLPIATDFAKLQVEYLKMVYYSLTNQFKHFKNTLTNTEKKFNKQDLDEFMPFITVLNFTIEFKNKQFEACYLTLEKYKQFKGTRVKANYTYLKLLLDHLTKNEALYVYAQDFGQYPELYHQLEVIKALSIGDFENAKKYWELLSKHNPSLYQENYLYQGDESVFSVALDIYKTRKKTSIDEKLINLRKNLLDKLDHIFQVSTSPLSKEQLIRMLWNEDLTEANSERLKNLILRYRKKFGYKVQCRQSTYWLEKKKSA